MTAAKFVLVEDTNATHPVTGDEAIKRKLELVKGERFSRVELNRYVEQIQGVYDRREPEAVAALAQRLLAEALRLDEVRADAVNHILDVIRERGLYVEPREAAGGRAPGVEPAETFEEFLERNRIEAQLARKAQLQAHGGDRKSASVQPYNYKVDQFGTGAEYLEARLRRDSPDHAAAFDRGEYRSIRAAAIAAGIVNPTAQLVLTKDPLASAQRVLEHRDPDWISEFIAALAPELIDPKAPAPALRDALTRGLGDRLPYVVTSLCRNRPDILDELIVDELPPLPAPPVAAAAPPDPPAVAPEIVPGVYTANRAAQILGVHKTTVYAALRPERCVDGTEILKRSSIDPSVRVSACKTPGNKPRVRIERVAP
jgi:hypothetical protein